MLGLTRENLSKFKRILLHQQKKVEIDLKEIDKEDPVMQTSLAESSEPGTDSWMADIHNRTISAKQNLTQTLHKIKQALINIRLGKYGKCEKCGKLIEKERLDAMPTAVLCISCSRKK